MAESIVGRLLGYLGPYAVEEIATYVGGKEKVKQLEDTMKMIQARLIDAERSREGEAGAALVKQWLKRLKDVLYRLEDLFEELSMTEDDHNDEMVCFCIPKYFCIPMLDRLKMNKKANTEAEAIMNDLEALTSDMHKLHLRVHSIEEQRAFNSRDGRETDSFVLDEEVIGRDEDKEKIVQMLLAQDLAGEGGVSVIPIVGMGGLGKTTLAQLAYKAPAVQQHFDIKWWACISETCPFEVLVGKVVKSITGSDCQTCSIVEIQSRLRGAVNNKRYLLVLDDVWDEDREKWLRLRRSLCCGKQGSKIIVTSRSEVVASNMGTVEPYELHGLTEDKSWELFESLAFRQRQEGRNPNLSRIGREIVKKCANVPLAIRTIAGILYSKDTEEEWVLLKDTEIRKLEVEENKIMSTLKLSYDHLPSRLKQCFAYCSLFPKDYEFDKQSLIQLWTSQGFVQPLDENQSPFDVGHTYFMELLRRCFFQDVQTSDFGIVRCKMHDLVHDLACMVGDECLSVDRSREHNRDDKNIRHVHFEFMNVVDGEWKAPSWLLASQQVRSLLLSHHVRSSRTNMNNILSGMRSLRALDFGGCKFDSLPESVAELKHLRYLRISVSCGGLPDWITRLQNLQTLELVPDIFVIKENEFPPRFGELKSLQALNRFVVGENNGLDALARMNLPGELRVYYMKSRPNEISEAMEANLKDKKLTSLFLYWAYMNDEEPITQADELLKCLQPPPTIKKVEVWGWKGVGFPSWGMDDLPCLLPNLTWINITRCDRCRRQPTFSRLPNLKYLQLDVLPALEYVEEGEGSSTGISTSEAGASSSAPVLAYFPSLEKLLLVKLPELKGWSRIHLNIGPNSLPRLQQLEIINLDNLEALPEWIDHLTQLRELHIESCSKLSELAESIVSLTALTHLEVRNCEVWGWKGVGFPSWGMDDLSCLLPNLTCIQIISCSGCRLLPTFSRLPNLLYLELEGLDALEYIEEGEERRSGNSTTTSISEAAASSSAPPLPYFPSLVILRLVKLPELKGWSRIHLNIGPNSLPRLRDLCIDECPKLKTMSVSRIGSLVSQEAQGMLHHLSNLQCLMLSDCDNLDLWGVSDDNDDGGMDNTSVISSAWQGLKNLRTLSLENISEMKSLPEGLSCLTTLQQLEISNLDNLEALPEWIDHLTQLRQLHIDKCSKLSAFPESIVSLTALTHLTVDDCVEFNKRRYEKPNGEGWPLIQHIPNIDFN